MPPSLLDIDDLVQKLTLEEKVLLLSGVGKCRTRRLEHHSIPSVITSDGRHGVRSEKFFNAPKAACLPSGTGMGATFDPDLIYRVGCLLAEEAKSHGVQLLLGPVVCLQRSPLVGRGFEAFGEDPIQSGTLGAQYINGLQDNGIGACIKHYAAHDQSDMSIEDNIIMTQWTLREVHTLPFQVAVRDSNPWAVMTAYHKINGVHCSEDPRLIRDILRGEWKYDGLVLCDWWGIFSTSESINAGMDLEMPGPTDWRGRILTWATRSRKVRMETVDSSVRRVLELVNKVLAAQAEPVKNSDTERNRALLHETTAASVLLKNEANVLPLVKDCQTRYALIGDHWKNPAAAGGGSAEVAPTLVEAVGEDSFICAMGCYSHKFSPLLNSTITQPGSDARGMLLEFFDRDPNGPSGAKLLYTTTTEKTDLNFADSLPSDTVPEVYFLRIRAVFRAPKTMKYRFGLSVAGKVKLFINNAERIDLWTSHPEKTDNTPCFNGFTMERFADVDVREGVTYDLELHLVNEDLVVRVGAAPAGGLWLGGFEIVDEDETIREAVEIARQVDIPIILTGLSADYEYERIDRKSLGLPGRVDELIERVTEANPKTIIITEAGTAITMPWAEKTPTVIHSWFGGQETGHGIVDVLFGDVNPSGRLPLTFPRCAEDMPSFWCQRTSRWVAEAGEFKVIFARSADPAAEVLQRGFELRKTFSWTGL